MTRTEIRLECLKLGYRADRLAAQVVAYAKEFESYISEPETGSVLESPEPEKVKGTSKKKSAGNPDFLT